MVKRIGCTPSRVSPNVNSELSVMMRQYCFISYEKCATRVGEVHGGGGCAGVETEEHGRSLCTFHSILL